MELDFHPAVLVGIDLVALLADDDRGLRSLDKRLRRQAWRAVGRVAGNRRQTHLEAGAGGIQVGALKLGRNDVERIANHQVLAVLVGAGMIGQLEQVPAAQATRSGDGCDLSVTGLQFLEPRLDVRFAVRRFGVQARIVVDLFILVLMPAIGGRGCLRFQIRLRIQEVEIPQNVLAGLKFLDRLPSADLVGLGTVSFVLMKGDLFVAGSGTVSIGRIAKHEGMLGLFVPEVVVDSFFLHQPADEVEIRLAVLDTVFPFAIRPGQRLRKIGKSAVTKDLFDDVPSRHLLENAAVRRPSQQPEPRAQNGGVLMQFSPLFGLRETGHVAVKIARLIVQDGQLDGDRFPHQVFELDATVLAQQRQFVPERLPQAFDP